MVKVLKNIFLYFLLTIFILCFPLVDENIEGGLSITAFAQNKREVIFEKFNTKIERVVDTMTDKKYEYLVLFLDAPIYMTIWNHSFFDINIYSNYRSEFSPDATHLIRVGNSPPFSLTYLQEVNRLVPGNLEEAKIIISALIRGEEVKLRYFLDQGYQREEQVDTTIQNVFLGYAYYKAATLFGWDTLGTSPELPPVKLNTYTPSDQEMEVSVQWNPDLKLVNYKKRGYASIKFGRREGFGINTNGEWIYNGGQRYGTITNYNFTIFDLNGDIIYEGETPYSLYLEDMDAWEKILFGDGRWPEGKTAAKKVWEAAPLGNIHINDIYSANTFNFNLYGFKELWQWGVDNLNFPPLGGDDIITKSKATISTITSPQTPETTKPLQGSLTEMITWEKTYGGNEDDSVNFIIQTIDGGYAVAGDTWSKGTGGSDAWIIKLDSQGNMVWDRTYGGNSYDFANSLIQTIDGGYALVGYTYSKGTGERDAWIIKLDSKGNLIWEKTYGGNEYDRANSIIQTTDGGYVVAGFTSSKGAGESDAWVIKLDSQGNMVWDRTYGGSSYDDASSIIQTTDGGYVVAGDTADKVTLNREAWIIKLDSKGSLIWEKTYGGNGSGWLNCLIQTYDGNYVLAGDTSKGYERESDAWIIKLDSKGNLIWEKTYGGNEYDSANSIIQTIDGGYVVAGGTRSKGAGWEDLWILKLDNQSKLLWDKTYGGINGDSANSIIQTTDGGYVVAGFARSKGTGGSDAWIIKVDVEGNLYPETAEAIQAPPSIHPLQGSLHCPNKAGYACPSCSTAQGYVNHFKGFNVLTTQKDCYVRLVTQDNSYMGNHNDCEVTVRGEKWLGLEDQSGTLLTEEIKKGNFDFKPANLFTKTTMTFPQDGYQYEFADAGKEFRLYLSRNTKEAFQAVPWQKLSVEIRNKETNKVFTYQFEKGIFPQAYAWPNGVANYGQCVWWAAKRWVEEVDSQNLFPFYPSSIKVANIEPIGSDYQPKECDVLIDYNPDKASELGHYGFVEKVEGDKIYITQFNWIKPGEVYNSISRFWNKNPKSLYYSLNPHEKYYFKYYYRK